MTTRVEKIGEVKNLVADQISAILEAAYPSDVSDLTALDGHNDKIADLVTLYRAMEIAETSNRQSVFNLGNIV
ncbi:hypothetical protein [Phyllobacterium myrsinacearum]|uniref:Uncharacterized protein n=1 Tax=Phyllobacterium myrsinacearum TaxID=28101 RepID=A0A839EBR8_9HYPH|nr:hypothetical protein [Phyllobacterium myrsinacearum]MBA8877403.1 hypothetical protein [Phyllobacterium myrsinacearum]